MLGLVVTSLTCVFVVGVGVVTDTGGLVGYTTGTISNIEIKSSEITGSEYTGGITGYTKSDINNVDLKNVNINSTGNYSGGIAGYQNNSNTETTNLNIDGITITGSANYVGGLFGQTEGKIKKQINTIKEDYNGKFGKF